jgi:hydroxyacylglutathione hydrolase
VLRLKTTVKYILVSHDHEDHFDPGILRRMKKHPTFRDATWIKPQPNYMGITGLDLEGEPLWLIHAPKHSRTDAVTVFRGFAMTGDIELGTLDSVNREVPLRRRRESLAFLAGFERTHDYRIRALASAHLNDHRTNIGWSSVIAAQD